ncbi:hypothetical protein ACUOH2_07310 [Escherichia coli]
MGGSHGQVSAVNITNDHRNKDHHQRQITPTPRLCCINGNIHSELSPDFGHSEAAHHAL